MLSKHCFSQTKRFRFWKMYEQRNHCRVAHVKNKQVFWLAGCTRFLFSHCSEWIFVAFFTSRSCKRYATRAKRNFTDGAATSLSGVPDTRWAPSTGSWTTSGRRRRGRPLVSWSFIGELVVQWWVGRPVVSWTVQENNWENVLVSDQRRCEQIARVDWWSVLTNNNRRKLARKFLAVGRFNANAPVANSNSAAPAPANNSGP